MEWEQNEFRITTQRESMDDAMIRRFLATESYWAKGVTFETVQRSLDGSLCFGLFCSQQQDRTTFAYLADVFVLPEFRGRGLGQWLLTCVFSHPDLQGLRRWMLVTGDAHEVYRCYGFVLSQPGRSMERLVPATARS